MKKTLRLDLGVHVHAHNRVWEIACKLVVVGKFESRGERV